MLDCVEALLVLCSLKEGEIAENGITESTREAATELGQQEVPPRIDK